MKVQLLSRATQTEIQVWKLSCKDVSADLEAETVWKQYAQVQVQNSGVATQQKVKNSLTFH